MVAKRVFGRVSEVEGFLKTRRGHTGHCCCLWHFFAGRRLERSYDFRGLWGFKAAETSRAKGFGIQASQNL